MAKLSMISAADLSAKEKLVVGVDANGKCALLTASGAIVGLLLDGGSASGDAVSVASIGEVAWGTASAAINEGARVTATTGSKLVTTTTDTETIVGIALTAAAADGDDVKVLVTLGMVAG